MKDTFVLVDGYDSLGHASENGQQLPVIGLKRLHSPLATACHPVERFSQVPNLIGPGDGKALAVVTLGHGLGDASHGNQGFEQASSHQQSQDQGHSRHGDSAAQDRLSRSPQPFIDHRKRHGNPDVTQVAAVFTYGQCQRDRRDATNFTQSGMRIQTMGSSP